MDKFRYLPRGKIKSIPEKPGVYSFRSGKEILYIGKAANLKVRVKNHFSQPTYRDNMFIEKTARVGYIELLSGAEALIIESQLIKKYQPRYNILLRDDKQYFYVGFSRDKLPTLMLTHQPPHNPPLTKGGKRGGVSSSRSAFLGPFTDGKSLKTVLKYLRKAFPYYTQRHRKLPCSYCHINLCPGPNPNVSEYKKNISKIKSVLGGKKPRVITSLKKEMAQLSKKQNFEKATRVRDQIKALENIFAHRGGGSGIVFERVSSPSGHGSRAIGAGERGRDPERARWASEESEKIIPLPPIKTLEAYDISNIQGREPVASMIRFDEGKPNKAMYRKFKIRLPEKPNDVAMIKEVIRRRLAHPEWPYPGVFLIDGGRGQLNGAISEVNKKLIHPPSNPPLTKGGKKRGGSIAIIKFPFVISLAKRFNELYLPNRKSPIPLNSLPPEIKNLLMYARDEAHRFAISYHRKLHRQSFW